MKNIEIKLRDGTTRNLRISFFAAQDGWDIENKLIRFAASDDAAYRQAYTMRILSYATVLVGDQEYPLSTDALIDNHLQSWQGIKEVFEEVLKYNGIEPKTHIVEFRDWDEVGAKIGQALVMYMSKVYEMVGDQVSTPEGK